VGLHGEPFRILKFRSMTESTQGPSVTVEGDHRVTRVGHVLRATKVDELPQLINVVRGEMSLVGPRPEVPEYAALWPEEARAEVLSVRPGITDPASVIYRRESEELAAAADPHRHYVEVVMPRKLDLYRRYVAEQSLLGDLRIVAQTIRTVVRG
jgi:lipopolysaccharide/colanic/teichoic acid biosynthesis glycosyltransferase